MRVAQSGATRQCATKGREVWLCASLCSGEIGECCAIEQCERWGAEGARPRREWLLGCLEAGATRPRQQRRPQHSTPANANRRRRRLTWPGWRRSSLRARAEHVCSRAQETQAAAGTSPSSQPAARTAPCCQSWRPLAATAGGLLTWARVQNHVSSAPAPSWQTARHPCTLARRMA